MVSGQNDPGSSITIDHASNGAVTERRAFRCCPSLRDEHRTIRSWGVDQKGSESQRKVGNGMDACY